ncbi:SMI1/KNR4 family protein [Hymenobacter arizonensis]|uniref:SMI1/KNR4 family protein n=1 Tax=Hymenobacter arizonensis TaxID=1227077 RepID=UPI000B85F269|nr:SMI1/KNR4 family protein [Hymenobacter arizonensis]
MPAELVRYFTLINGTGAEYDESFFCFYGLAELQSVAERFHDYHGSPKYSDLLHSWPDHARFYVIADYLIHTFAYAIWLGEDAAGSNPVYVLYGGEYRLIAENFTAFLALYKRDSAMLYLEDEEPPK